MVNIWSNNGQAQASQSQDQSLVQMIERGNLLPIVSGDALEDLVIEGHAALVARYAEFVGYPFQDRKELHKLVKYQSLVKVGKDQPLKAEYLDVVATHLFELAAKRGTPADKIAEAIAQAGALKVSGFAQLLGFPHLGEGATNPLEILANLPLPIFVTTSPYTFIEAALENAGKTPVTEFCRWRPEFGGIASPLAPGGSAAGYQPTEKTPLVYHLYGLDRYEESLVLTEDDYLDFLMAVSQDRGKDVDPVHSTVKSALQSKALLLMGFSLPSWPFRTLYRGLIKPMPPESPYQRFCCLQVAADKGETSFYENYLRKEARFDQVYWKDIEAFCREDLPVKARRSSPSP